MSTARSLLFRGAGTGPLPARRSRDAGGAPLLGVDGVVIIGHGISSAKAIRNAIRVARESILERVNDRIIDGISNYLNTNSNQPSKTIPIHKVNP